MVKLSNHGKSKPSKRMTLKRKYKIRSKVLEHNRKARRQAKKMRSKGIKHKNNQQRDALPNMYPFKQQIMEQYKDLLPKKQEETIQELSSQQLGLVIKQNKVPYFGKTKQNSQRKYITNLEQIIKIIDVAIVVLDARNIQICHDQEFQLNLQKFGVKICYIISRSQTVEQLNQDPMYHPIYFQGKHKDSSMNSLIKKLKEVKENQLTLAVFGKGCTSKHKFIELILKFSGIYKSSLHEVNKIKLNQKISLIDTPFRVEDKTNYPLFNVPQNQPIISQQQQILKLLLLKNSSIKNYKCPILNHEQFLIHYSIQDFISIDDMLKKIGKTLRIFGKGGMVDINKVRQKILIQWYSGKLNKIINTE